MGMEIDEYVCVCVRVCDYFTGNVVLNVYIMLILPMYGHFVCISFEFYFERNRKLIKNKIIDIFRWIWFYLDGLFAVVILLCRL